MGQPPMVDQEAESEAMQKYANRDKEREEVSEEENGEEKSRVEKETRKESVPIKSENKWEKEKKPTRSLARIVKKPNLLGNIRSRRSNKSQACLPSVYEIEAPQKKHEIGTGRNP